MTLHRLVVHDRPYILDAPAAEAVAVDIVDAVRSGGDLVAFTASNGAEYRVLITPATPVHLERVAEADEPDGSDAADEALARDYEFDFDLDI